MVYFKTFREIAIIALYVMTFLMVEGLSNIALDIYGSHYKFTAAFVNITKVFFFSLKNFMSSTDLKHDKDKNHN